MLLSHLRRGVLAGLAAGLVFGLLTALVANPLIGVADGLAHDGHVETDNGDGEGVVSLAVTETVSVLSGVFWGALLGAVVFGVAFYLLEPAIPGTGATKSALAAAAGFVTVSGAPWLVLPPAPPGATQTLPVGTRIQLYAGMMVAGALACLIAGAAYSRARQRWGRPVALIAGMLPLALLGVPAVLAPSPGIEHGLPPAMAAGLTGLVVFGQVLLWATMAGTHAWLSRSASTTERRVAAPGREGPSVTAD